MCVAWAGLEGGFEKEAQDLAEFEVRDKLEVRQHEARDRVEQERDEKRVGQRLHGQSEHEQPAEASKEALVRILLHSAYNSTNIACYSHSRMMHCNNFR